MKNLTETILDIMNSGLANCESCEEFYKECDLEEGLCEECKPNEEEDYE